MKIRLNQSRPRATLDEDSPQSIAPAGSTVLVRTLHEGGQTIRAVFDKDLYDGAQTLFISGTEYRLYLRTLSGGQHIAVAQKMREIEKIARQTALAASLPILGMSVVLFVILAAHPRRSSLVLHEAHPCAHRAY